MLKSAHEQPEINVEIQKQIKSIINHIKTKYENYLPHAQEAITKDLLGLILSSKSYEQLAEDASQFYPKAKNEILLLYGLMSPELCLDTIRENAWSLNIDQDVLGRLQSTEPASLTRLIRNVVQIEFEQLSQLVEMNQKTQAIVKGIDANTARLQEETEKLQTNIERNKERIEVLTQKSIAQQKRLKELSDSRDANLKKMKLSSGNISSEDRADWITNNPGFKGTIDEIKQKIKDLKGSWAFWEKNPDKADQLEKALVRAINAAIQQEASTKDEKLFHGVNGFLNYQATDRNSKELPSIRQYLDAYKIKLTTDPTEKQAVTPPPPSAKGGGK